jgi:hypothetical protein
MLVLLSLLILWFFIIFLCFRLQIALIYDMVALIFVMIFVLVSVQEIVILFLFGLFPLVS